MQQSILQSAGRLVKTGGRLIYATCSVFKAENEQQIENFLKNNPHFKLIDDKPYFNVTPHENGVDGFFAAILERIAV